MKTSLIFIASIFIFLSFQTVFSQSVLDGKKVVANCNGHAKYLPKPEYPSLIGYGAHKYKGTINIQVLINENGDVESAKAITGHPFFRSYVEKAALKAKFRTSFKSPTKVPCVISYYIDAEKTEQSESDNKSPGNTSKENPRICTGGVCNSIATYLPQPIYPEEAREQKISGTISVRVSIDEEGNVTSAETCSGHPLLRKEAEKASLKAKFKPTKISGIPVKVSCVLVYKFLPEKQEQIEETPQPYFEPPIISLGNINNKAKILPMPKLGAVQPQGDGSISVEVKIDLQKGKVISAMAFEGHPLMRDAAVKAAMQAEFEPILTEFPTIYGKGTLVYKFEDFNGEMIKNDNAETLLKFGKIAIINGMATHFPIPDYSQEAKDFCADGLVKIKVLRDEYGNVVSAVALSGDELLLNSAVEAAKKVKFNVGHFNVKMLGILVYKFESENKCIDVGVVNKKAKSIPKLSFEDSIHWGHLKLINPIYIRVQVIIDVLSGDVIRARALDGHYLIRNVLVNSVLKAKFHPSFINSNSFFAKGVIVYKIKPNGEVEF